MNLITYDGITIPWESLQGNPDCIPVQSRQSKLGVPDNWVCQGKDVSTKAMWNGRSWGGQGDTHFKRVQKGLVMGKVEPVSEFVQASQTPGRSIRQAEGPHLVSAKPPGSSCPCILLYLCSSGAFQGDVTKQSGTSVFPVNGDKAIVPGHMNSLENREVGCKALHVLSPIYQLSNRGGTCPANIPTMNPWAAGQNWANSQGRS